MPTYIEHLRSNTDNENLYIKCNTCYQSCPNWDSFRRHNLKYHKDNNPLDLLNDDQSMLKRIISDSSNNAQENVTPKVDPFLVDDQFSSEFLQKLNKIFLNQKFCMLNIYLIRILNLS
jgi:hypothetical protein